MTSPDASVPDLKSKSKPVLWVVLGVLAVVLIGGIVWFALGPKDKVDPGPAACAHIERQAEIAPDAWDAFVEQMVTVVQERVVSKTENVALTIRSGSRKDRCSEIMRKLQRSLAEQNYDALAACIASVGSANRAVRCLDAIQQ